MSNFIKRITSGIIYVLLFISFVLISKETYIILISVFGFLCIWEFSKMIYLKNIVPYILLPIVMVYFYYYGSDKNNLLLLGITLLCSVRLIYHLFSENNTYPKTFISKLDLCIRYIIFPISFLILLPFTNNQYNGTFVIFILIILWVNDSFAFLVGKNFGKHKLFERISPKKTIEGFVGGAVFSVITASIIAKYTTTFSTLNWIFIALIVVIFGTLGDLVESKFKRQAKIKDSGNIMPGHGGILDRLDSLLFSSPFIYLYIHYLM
ncbi:phosphatidate cytidylyltransferase [Tenacibaculum sp. UWU-22]|uniref:phosphatidate cytidylyltransferase n=1 Tax=Tenacibaculum sp. UWU-22 TaxID=3234187 RepID=UPI0034DB6BA6